MLTKTEWFSSCKINAHSCADPPAPVLSALYKGGWGGARNTCVVKKATSPWGGDIVRSGDNMSVYFASTGIGSRGFQPSLGNRGSKRCCFDGPQSFNRGAKERRGRPQKLKIRQLKRLQKVKAQSRKKRGTEREVTLKISLRLAQMAQWVPVPTLLPSFGWLAGWPAGWPAGWSLAACWLACWLVPGRLLPGPWPAAGWLAGWLAAYVSPGVQNHPIMKLPILVNARSKTCW